MPLHTKRKGSRHLEPCGHVLPGPPPQESGGGTSGSICKSTARIHHLTPPNRQARLSLKLKSASLLQPRRIPLTRMDGWMHGRYVC
eukprot:scaffold600614_cov45-Prasinocladus_malaysianus.AAC.1